MPCLPSVVQDQLRQNDWEGQALASTWIFKQETHYFKKMFFFFFFSKRALAFAIYTDSHFESSNAYNILSLDISMETQENSHFMTKELPT